MTILCSGCRVRIPSQDYWHSNQLFVCGRCDLHWLRNSDLSGSISWHTRNGFHGAWHWIDRYRVDSLSVEYNFPPALQPLGDPSMVPEIVRHAATRELLRAAGKPSRWDAATSWLRDMVAYPIVALFWALRAYAIAVIELVERYPYAINPWGAYAEDAQERRFALLELT